jgi:hypothetical protein
MAFRQVATSSCVAVVLVAAGLSGQRFGGPPSPPLTGAERALRTTVERILAGDGSICDAVSIALSPEQPETIWASIDYSGRHFCNTLLRISLNGVQLQRFGTWQLDALAPAFGDLDRDGNVELILAEAFSEYESGPECVATTPVVYSCSTATCVDRSNDFAGFYLQELDRIDREWAQLENAGSERELRAVPCRIMEGDRIRRRLNLDPIAGFAVAEQWMRSQEPGLRRKAAVVFGDIATQDALKKLQTLSDDKDPGVAAAARRALSKK